MVNGGGGYNRSCDVRKMVQAGADRRHQLHQLRVTDGSTWTQVGNTNLTDFGTTIYAGMFTYAEPDGNLSVPWAKFDNVSILGNILGPPTVNVTPQTDTVLYRPVQRPSPRSPAAMRRSITSGSLTA